MKRRNRAAGAIGVLMTATAWAAAEGTFPFVIPGDDASPTATDFSGLNGGPIGEKDRVVIRDGHFRTSEGRLKIWGMNVCFAANFPSHEDAEKAAAHLAKLGINGIRFHHHDTSDEPRGLWVRGPGGARTVSGSLLERQDYFLAQLNRHGIYADLNLHVGRMLAPRDAVPDACRYDKYLLYFMPEMRAKLKEFCRAYLDHVNPYRKLRRADDPGIAVVEITNENSFSTRGPSIAARLPEPYRGEFRRQWNAWLRRTYGSTDRMRAAWRTAGDEPGAVLFELKADGSDLKGWSLHQSSQAPVRLVPNEPGPRPDLAAIRLDIVRPSGAVMQQEWTRRPLDLEKGKAYTLRFWVRAEQARKLFVDVSRSGPDRWDSVGFSETLEVGPAWQEVVRVFRCTDVPTNGPRLCFKFGGSPADLWLAGLRLRAGAELTGLKAGDSLEDGTVDIPVSGWPEPALADATRFMVDTEKEFIRDLTQFLKKDLGVKAPVTASQITYHGARIVADTCDFADIHAYWQHPHFPVKAWDPKNWIVKNTPMECDPGYGVLFERAAWRLFDRPFTMSEWNIPAPHDAAASVVPFAALTAALQDWDGVFFFDYDSSSDRWNRDAISGFFSFNGHPAKLALLGACANLYRRGDLAPLKDRAAGACDDRQPAALGLSRRIGIDPSAARKDDVPLPQGALRSPGGTAVWDATDKAKAHILVHTPATRAAWGLVAGQSFDLGGLQLRIGAMDRPYAAIVATSLDGAPLESSRRMLLVAVASAANQGMVWNETRTSVGNQWGRGPTIIEGVPASVVWPGGRIASVRVLDGAGTRGASVTVSASAGPSSFEIGPANRTLWYELTRE